MPFINAIKLPEREDGLSLQLQMEANVGVLQMLLIFTKKMEWEYVSLDQEDFRFSMAKEVQAVAVCILQVVSDKLKILSGN